MAIPEHVLQPRAGQIPRGRWHQANGSLERPNPSGGGLAVMEPIGARVRHDRYMERVNLHHDGAAPSIARDPMGARHKAWNDEGNDFRILSFQPLPVGLMSTACGGCGSKNLSGAIIAFPDGTPVIPSADADDPNVVCLGCEKWWD